MKGEFTAIIAAAPEGGYWAVCPEIPGANGQGETPDDAKQSLRQAIELKTALSFLRPLDLHRHPPSAVVSLEYACR